MSNYYFPDYTVNNCGFGRDYPAWMGDNGYEKSYLFTTGEECCSRFFPTTSGCPYENTKQTGYYWESYQENRPNAEALPPIANLTYYPDLNSNTCIQGDDYPSWMAADDIYKRLYIYYDAEGCCSFWFGKDSSCVASVFTSTAGVTLTAAATNSTNATEALLILKSMWYPQLDARMCSNDGFAPDFMLNDGYTQWYLFNTQAACCAAFDCSGV